MAMSKITADRSRGVWSAVRSRARDDLLRVRAKLRWPRLDVTVAANDNMQFGGTLRTYFEVGADALRCIEDGLGAAKVTEVRRVLDLPSGYGRVLRHLRRRWPAAAITAMDVLPDAVSFCARRFAARPVVSRDPLWLVDEAGDGYNVLWSGSLLTHLPATAWPSVLTYFRDRVTVGGAVIFTTHGERSAGLVRRDPAEVLAVHSATGGLWDGDYGIGEQAQALLRDLDRTGFGYAPYAWSRDARWGTSVSQPAWVQDVIGSIGGLELARHVAHGWFQHQDVWTCVRTS